MQPIPEIRGSPPLPEEGISLLRLVTPLAQAKVLILVSTLLCAVLFYALAHLIPKSYTASFRLLPPQTNSQTASVLLNQVGGATSLGSSAIGVKNPGDLYAGILRSRAISKPVISQLNLVAEFNEKSFDHAERRLLKSLKISAGKDGILEVEITDTDAKRSAEIGNTMITALYDLSRKLTLEESKRRQEFHGKIVNDARLRLLDLEDELYAEERVTGLTRLKGQEENVSAAAGEIQGLITTKELEISSIERYATSTNPELISARRQLAQYRNQLRELRALSGRYGGLSNGKVDKTADDLLTTFDRMYRLRRDIKLQEAILENAVRVAEAARVDEQRDLSVIQVLDRAEIPTAKSGPRYSLGAILGAMTGCLVSIMLVIAADAIRSDAKRHRRWLKFKVLALRWRRRP